MEYKAGFSQKDINSHWTEEQLASYCWKKGGGGGGKDTYAHTTALAH